MRILLMLVSFLAVIVVYVSMNYYIAKRLFRWVKFVAPAVNGKVFASLYSLLALMMFVAFMPLPKGLDSIVNWISAYWMGVFVYLLLFFIIVDVLLVILVITKLVAKPISQRTHFIAGSVAVVLTVIVVGYGIYNATKIRHVTYEVETNAEKNKEQMNIVLISDLHLGAVKSESRIEEMVAGINKQKPDLVLLAGDIFNDDFNDIQDPERAIELFKSIDATYGVYGSLGNHDGGTTLSKMVNFLAESNIQLLTDEYEIIDKRLVLIGRLDPSPIGGFGDWQRSEINHLFEEFDEKLPVVVIDHTPSNLEQYGKEIDLIVSGHTHHGQMFPGSLFTDALFEVDYGKYQRDENSPHVIVSSGVGTWGMPMRVGTYNEIVTIQLN